MSHGIVRCLRRLAMCAGILAGTTAGNTLLPGDEPPRFQIASFSADVTPPRGSPLLGGSTLPVQGVDDPLLACGYVLWGSGKPIVVVAVDWCEIRNDSYDDWRQKIATAAGTTPDRVLLACVHQHDAPIDDMNAQRILEETPRRAIMTDIPFHHLAVKHVAQAVYSAVQHPQPVTHIGLGKAEVREVASNRRYRLPSGEIRFDRASTTVNPQARAADAGTIDPLLKTLSFWNGDKPLVAVSAYATHPMSYYRTGRVTCDFPGLARNRRQTDLPGCRQIYFSGASGNITAGKYNDGNHANRRILADRMYAGMVSAWQNTVRHPLTQVELRSAPLLLPIDPRPERSLESMRRTLTEKTGYTQMMLAAHGLAWRARRDAGYAIALPCLDFGEAQFLLLPGESYVEFQLIAQKLRPGGFVMTAGYGECQTGYLATERAWQERDANLNDWCFTGPGSEQVLRAALRRLLSLQHPTVPPTVP